MGTKDGRIIATIITPHMPRNDAAATDHVCPGIRIHAIDIVQPPGIGISPIADMDVHQTIVTAALAAKSSAETPKNACREARSEAMHREISSPAVTPRHPRRRSALVLVVAAPPDARLVASPGRVGSAYGGELGDGLRDRCRVHRVAAAPVVVFDAPLALLLLGEPDVEVEVEVAAERGRPGERPPHPPLVRPQLRERRPRHRRKRDVVVGQVDDEAVEPIRDRRAGRTPRRVVGPEHEVVDEELRAPSEEVCQRGAPLVGLESILLVDPNPRQLLPPPRQLVAAPRELLLRLEQLEPHGEPLFTCSGLVCRHRLSLPSSDVLVRSVFDMIYLVPGIETVGVTSVAGFRW